ncbi:hypothetical protein [Bradyrhizobium paxllaeri]|uniref:hypothetical protein n=1 Tax=Bradyrhizobium paxllaeri TaxID=190148 RepID=UPI000810DB60|nr:hypothetical protein [Bradyrhizobium paxllaeri]
MSGSSLRTAVFLFACLVVSPASAAGPGSTLKHLSDETFTSPDGQVRVEQYSRERGNDILHQFWIFDGKQRASLLNPGEGADIAGYRAAFRFTPDSRWLVRMQKLGAGYQTLLLYRRDGDRFSPATTKPLGKLAWDYLFSLPVSKGMQRPLNHTQVHLLKGLDENYAWLGKHWPDSRYLVLSLSFDIQGQKKPSPWVEGWRCVYDMKTGKFTVPPAFADHNATAVKRRDQARR